MLEYCEGCKTKELRKNIADLAEKLVGGLTNIDKNDIKKNTKTTLIKRNDEVDSSGFFIAVGGVCEIIKSDNGKDWQVVNTDNCKRLLGVTRGNKQIIAVGISGKIFNSEDGVDWFLNNLITPDSFANFLVLMPNLMSLYQVFFSSYLRLPRSP